MINFNTVIDNFDRVYKAKTQKEENIFLNSSLELVETPSEKACFFEVIAALQFRKWDSSSVDSTSPQLSRSIKKILLQAKLIYDNDPFPIKIPCKYIELLDKSIIEGFFLDPAKVEVYAEEIRKYCEILYFYKLLIEADEKLSKISNADSLNLPPNLEEFNKSSEELFYKILFLIQTKEFKFLTKAKYKDTLLYLNVFIEGTEEKIEKTYPDILHILQLAELAYSKDQLHSTKGKEKFTAQELRDKFLSILNNPISEKIKQKNTKDKIFFMAGYNRSTSPFFKDIDKYKEEMKLYLYDLGGYISYYEDQLDINKKNISISTEYKLDFSKDIQLLKISLEKMKSYLHVKAFAPLCFQYFPFLETQHTYVNSFRNLITTVKIEKLGFNTGSRSLKKSKEGNKQIIIENSDRITLQSSSFEQKIIQEHFPTLIQKSTHTGDEKTFSLLKRELINAAKIYTLLTFELCKTHAVNSSLKEKTSTISPDYVDLIKLLSGNESPSLPSAEKFSEIHKPESVSNFFSAFFCFKEIKYIDQIIDTFYKQTKKNLETKLKEYSQEFIRLKKQKKTPIKRPKGISKDSFTASTSKKDKDEVGEPSSINCEETTNSQLINCSAVTIQQKTSTSENVILESTKNKKTNFRHDPSSLSLKERVYKVRNALIPITSLKMLSLVTAEQKKSTIFYNDHVSRWFYRPDDALNDPKYAGHNITKSQRKESVAYHAFPSLIDSLLNTNYSLKKVDPNDDSIIRYGIPGTISFGTQKHHGIFEYTINADNICFHRCFSRKTDTFEKVKPLTVTKDSSPKIEREYFSFGKTPIELNTKKREITITDSKTDVEFTIVHPDDYWKLPNKITNSS